MENNYFGSHKISIIFQRTFANINLIFSEVHPQKAWLSAFCMLSVIDYKKSRCCSYNLN